MCLLSALPQLSSGHTYISCTCYFATMGILNWNLPLSSYNWGSACINQGRHFSQFWVFSSLVTCYTFVNCTKRLLKRYYFLLHQYEKYWEEDAPFSRFWELTQRWLLFRSLSINWGVAASVPSLLSAALTKVKQFFSGNENYLPVSALLCLAWTLYWQHVATPTNIWHDSTNFQTLI